MESVKQRFRNLNTIVDDVHSLFERWANINHFEPMLDVDTVYRSKLVTHEWIANLVQHAKFADDDIDVTIDIWRESDRLMCVVEDNSEGFDLMSKTANARNSLDRLPERGMGLLMLRACTEDLSYERTPNSRNRLKFSIPSGQEPWLDIPF